MKYVYITVDIEEWYDLEYLKKYQFEQNVETIPEIIEFLDLLDQLEIKATFFVLVTALNGNLDILKEIVRRGHAIACHGFDHEMLYNKENTRFEKEVSEAKRILEESLDVDIYGYRAACFSMDDAKLDILSKVGYRYDSSYIKFEQHELYGDLNLSNFEKIDDLVHCKKGFVEYEIPTLKIGKFYLPISGGGYLRLFPYPLLLLLIKRFAKYQNNFLLYLHPFELTSIRLPLPKEISLIDRFRVSVGRKRNMKKLKKVLLLLKSMGAEFRTLDEDMKERLEKWRTF